MNKNFFHVFSGSLMMKILSAVSSFLLTYIVTKSVSVDDAGAFFLGISIVAISNTLSFHGLENLIIKNSAKNETDFISWSFYKVLASCILITIIILIVYYFFVSYYENIELPIILIISIIPVSMSFFNSFVFQGRENIISANFSQTIMINCIFVISILFFGINNLKNLSLFYFISAGITWLVYSVSLYKKNEHSFSNKNYHPSKIEIKEAKYLYVVSIAMLINQWFGQIFISTFLDNNDIAIYTVSQRISLLLTFLLLAINFIVSSRYSFLFDSKDYIKIRLLNYKIYILSFSVAIPIFAFICIFPKEILSLFGSQYEDGYITLIVLCFGQVVNVITGPVNYILIMSGNSSILKNNVIIASLFSFIFLPPFTLFFGIFGTAIIITLSVILQNLLCLRSSFKLYPKVFLE